MTTPILASQPEDTVKRSPLILVVFLLFGFVLGLTVGYMTWGANPIQKQVAVVPTAQAPGAGQAQGRIEIPIGTAPVWGPENATVTIIEFSDYECPFCTKWHNEVWPQIQKAYPNQIRLVYKDFPLDIHANASPAALAARCANDQNKYWQFHDRLLSGKPLSAKYFETIATDLGLDLTKWKDCQTSKKYNKDIEADYTFGGQLGITGTPTFFINNIRLVGAQPFSAFKQIIDQELAAKK